MEHHFDVDDAKKYGIEEAIILYNLRFWIKKNEANKKHFHDEKYWTYNSSKAFAELFPYMSTKKIARYLESLEENGAIIKGNFNNNPFDRTLWYAINNQTEIVDIPKMGNAFPENEKCTFPENEKSSITDNETPDTKPDTKQVKRSMDKSISLLVDNVSFMNESNVTEKELADLVYQTMLEETKLFENYAIERKLSKSVAKGILNLDKQTPLTTARQILLLFQRRIRTGNNYWKTKTFSPKGITGNLDSLFKEVKELRAREEALNNIDDYGDNEIKF